MDYEWENEERGGGRGGCECRSTRWGESTWMSAIMKGVQGGGVNRASVNMSGEGVEGVGGREFNGSMSGS